MSSASPAEIRAFYAALGVELSEWAQQNAAVRCFAAPDAHAREDRSPSCSVSVHTGAWKCHGCGADGGPYDAALARGRSPRQAMDLLITHSLAERRGPATKPTRRQRSASPLSAASAPPSPPRPLAEEADVERWRQQLFSAHARLLRERLWRERRWTPGAMRELGIGWDGQRITIPVRVAGGALRGVLRYRPGGPGPKMLAVPGTRLGLIPHPATERSERILLVEGPPDMLAARSRGWPAIAVPGDHAWRPEWAALLRGRTVSVLMDCDPQGRAAARRIAADLASVASVRVLELAAARHDGYDLTDWLATQPQQRRSPCRTSSSSKPTITR